METYVPPTPPVEDVPKAENPRLKNRWNFLEVFKKRDEEPAQKPSTAEQKTSVERAADQPIAPERRRFAAKVLRLLRGEQEQLEPGTQAETQRPGHIEQPERAVPVAAIVPEAPARTAEAPLPFVERAKEMGRGVLRLIGRVREEVQMADQREHLMVATNTEPLVSADADVRAAMQELIAPIEALEPRVPTPETPAPDAIDTVITNGGDGAEAAHLAQETTPFSRTLEVAASVASITAREMLDAKEKMFRRTSPLRKVGLFALGAATVGGFVYTWRRVREIKKEQRALRREHKRFEAEVRANQEKEESRLQELQETNVRQLTQPERQQYVQQVSEFAHATATGIRTAARTREEVAERRPAMPHATPVADKHRRPAIERTPEDYTAGPATPEQNVVERLTHAVRSNLGGGAFAGGVAAAGAALLGGDKNKTDSSTPQMSGQNGSQQPAQSPSKQSVQAWFWGAVLGASIVIFVILWALRIL